MTLRGSKSYKIDWMLAASVSILFLIVFLLAYFMPLQTDEINWSYANQRAVIDGHKVMTLLPQCLTLMDFSKDLPLSWYPHAYFNHFVYMHISDPQWVRIIGMVRAALIVLGFWWLARSQAAHLNLPKTSIFISVLCFILLDELPLLLQVNRPEQSILLVTLLCLILAINAKGIRHYKFLQYSSSILLILSVLLLFPSHPKAIVLLPLVLICSGIFFQAIFKNKYLTSFLLSGFFLFAVNATLFWLERYECPHSEISREVIHNNSPVILAILRPFWEFPLNSIILLMRVTLSDFNIHIHTLLETWLPSTISSLNDPAEAAITFMNGLTIAIRILALGYCCKIFWRMGRALFLRQMQGASHNVLQINQNQFLGSMVFCTLIGFILFSGANRIFYFALLHLPLLLISTLLLLYKYTLVRIPIQRLKYLMIVIAILNGTMMIYRYYPYIQDASKTENITAARPIMLARQDYGLQQSQIKQAYEECGLPESGKARHLILDDYTYPVLRESFQPFSYQYVTNLYAIPIEQFDLNGFIKFAKDFESDGIIMDCRFVPAPLKTYLKEYNGYCCAKTTQLAH